MSPLNLSLRVTPLKHCHLFETLCKRQEAQVPKGVSVSREPAKWRVCLLVSLSATEKEVPPKKDKSNGECNQLPVLQLVRLEREELVEKREPQEPVHPGRWPQLARWIVREYGGRKVGKGAESSCWCSAGNEGMHPINLNHPLWFPFRASSFPQSLLIAQASRARHVSPEARCHPGGQGSESASEGSGAESGGQRGLHGSLGQSQGRPRVAKRCR